MKNTMKKILSLMLAVLICFSCMLIPVEAATFNDINQSGVFVKQQKSDTCTLASAVMLVRRTAMAIGNSNWSSITESSMRGTAWLEGQGLYYNFTYAGVSVGHSTISSNRKNTYINLLKTYPQGVVAWNSGNGGQYHAVLLTDYDANTDTFYCADPANGTASGRIPLSSSSIVGSGQDGKINNLDHYWYVKSPSITLTSNEPTTVLYPTSGSIVKFASGVGNNMYLDFACTNINVQIYENCVGHSNPDFVKSQYFKLTHVGDGWYTITNPANGKAMDVYDWRTVPETNIQQWDLHSGDCQLFRFYDAGDGYCYIKSKLGTYVDVQNGDNVNNTNVWAYSFNGSNAQKWKIQTHSHSYSSTVTKAATCTATGIKTFTCYCGASYTETLNKLEHTNSWDDNKCDVCGTVLIAESTKILYPENNQIVKIQTAIGSDKFLNADLWSENIRIYEDLDGNSDLDLIMSQYFKITHIGDGWYTIVNIGNGNAMDVESFNTASKTNIKHYTLHGGDNQLFRFYDAGDGYCYIKSKLGTYVDVVNGNNANNINVWAHAFNGGGAQKWKLHTHSHVYTSSINDQSDIDKVVITYDCYCGTSYTEVVADKAYSTVYKGTTYILYDGSMPYADAKEFCKKIGGHLVKITSQEENDVVAGLITTFGHISWINGTDEIEEGTWCFDDGEEMPYFNWDEGEPNSHQGNDQDYLAMNIRTKWDDYHGSAYGFVCEIEHTEHYYISSITTQPTCTKEGVKTHKCSCGDSYTESIDKKPHTIVVIPAVTSTCTKTGLTEGKKCSVCGTVTVAQQSTSKKAHTEVVDNAVSATCSKTGLTEGKHCSVCNTVTVAQQTVATVPHIDNNSDYECDYGCGYTFEQPADPTPDEPTTPDTPKENTKNCSCNCHKGGISGLIWKILRFFYKLFKINPVCSCGVAHY